MLWRELGMRNMKRSATLAAAMLLAAALLSGCSTFGDDPGIAANDQPSQLPPVTDSAVSSDSLPPLGGAAAANATTSTDVASASPPPLSGATPPTPAYGQSVQIGGGVGNAPPAGGNTPTGASPAGGAPGGQGSFVSLNDVNQPPAAGARDLSGGLTAEKLLGGWTVTSGQSQCRLNLTYTAAGSNDRYRASAPGCSIATLAQVASWRLSGTQVQLFDGGNRLVGALLLSGNRFIGTLTGGQAILMAG